MKFVSERFEHYFKRAKDFCVYKVLHADDPPHRLALGIAIGMFVTFTPLIGFQMLISVFLAWLFRANKLVGVPLVWISNPFTAVPIYYGCFAVGCKVLGMSVSEEWQQIGPAWDTLLKNPSASLMDKISFWWRNLLDLVGPLGLGCLIVATFAGILSYYISLYVIRSYRLRRWGQLMPPSLTPVESIEDSQVTKKESATGENAA